MYNEYDDLSFEEQLHLTEEEMRRRHNQQMFLRRNAQMLQQELELEAELLEENPELAQIIHALNMQEIQAQQQGLFGVMQGDSTPRANASKLLLITTKVKNQRKNQDFALDYFLSPKAIA